MSDQIYFDGKRFVSAYEASVNSGLTRDYVSKLCRDGKVVARRVGKNWYVEHASFQNFQISQEHSRAQRKETLSEERVREYNATGARSPLVNESAAKSLTANVSEMRSDVHTSKRSSVIISKPVPAGRPLVGRTEQIQKTFEGIVAGKSSRALQAASGYASAPGAADAAMRLAAQTTFAMPAQMMMPSIHVPLHTITPATEFVHKLIALTLAFMLTFGTYALVDPQYARFAITSMRDTGRSVLASYESVTDGGASVLAARTQSGLTSIAENPGAFVASAGSAIGSSIPNAAEKFARMLNARLDRFVYAIAFPASLTHSLDFAFGGSDAGAVAVNVQPYARAASGEDSQRSLPLSASTPTSGSNAAVVSGSTTIVNRPVVERVVETERVVQAGGISEALLDEKLNQLNNKLVAQIYGITSAPSTLPASGGYMNNIAISQRIDRLASVSISNSSISGTTISGGSISDASISGGSVSGASISATSFSASGDTSLATTTINGSLQVASASSSTEPFVVKDTTGTTIFAVANDGTLTTNVSSTTSSYSQLLITGSATATTLYASNLIVSNTASTTNNLTINSTTTNATSTNFFATLGHLTTGIIDTLSAAAATITSLVATTISGTNLTYTNATTTNATSTNLAVTNLTSFAAPMAPYFTATSTTASSFPYASSTAITVSGRSFFDGGFLALASSTIGNGTQAGGLTISGGATTTGDFVITKASAPTTGSLYFGSGTANINYNSSDFTLTGGNFYTAAGRITSVGLNETIGLGVRYVSGDGTYYVGATHSASPDFVFTNNGNLERARLTDGGYFGIGTTTPSSSLSVQGNALFSGNLGLANLTATGTLAVAGAATLSSTFNVTGGTTLANATSTSFFSTTASSTNLFSQTASFSSLTLSSPLAQTSGGTGFSAYTAGDILYADNVGVLTKLAVGSNGSVLKLQAGLPAWGTDNTGSGGGSSGYNMWATTTLNLIYPIDTSYPVAIGANSTSSAFSIFEVHGIQYISSKLGIATTSPVAALSVEGNGYINGGLGVGLSNTTSGTLQTSGAATIGGAIVAASTISAVGTVNTSGTTGGYKIDNNLILQSSSTRSSIAVGQGALNTSYTGIQNTALGGQALNALTSGAGNTALGYSSLLNVGSSAGNTGVGFYSLVNTTGANNTGLGYQAGRNITTGSNNLILGSNVNAPAADGSQQLNIGNILYGTNLYNGGSESAVPVTNGNLGIGTSTPWGKLAISLNNGDTNTNAFVIASSTAAYATSTLFSVSNTGQALFTTSGNAAPSIAMVGDATTGLRLTTGTAFLVASGVPVIGINSTNFYNPNISNGYQVSLAAPSATAPTFIPNRSDVTTGIGASAASALSFITSGTTKLEITNGGYVGIGTTTPSTNLSVQGNALFSGNLSLANLTATGTITTAGLTNTGVFSQTGLASFALASTSQLSVFNKAYFGGTATTTIDSAGNILAAGTLNVTGLTTLTNASSTQLSVFNKAYFGGTATSTFDSTGALLLSNALTYGGVTLSNAVTGTGNMVLSASPTLTGTLTAAAANFSGLLSSTNASTSLLSVFNKAYFGGTATSTFDNVGNFYAVGTVGIGTTTPWAKLSVSTAAQQSGTLPLFNIASTTNAALFTVLGNSNVGVGTASPQGRFAVSSANISQTWAPVGSALSIATAGGPALASLSPNRVAFIDGANDSLRTYEFDGTNWVLIGSGLSVVNFNPALAALSPNRVAYIDSTNDSLRTYEFNGTTWSQVGSGLTLSVSMNAALAALGPNRVAFIDDSTQLLGMYEFNGSTWSLVGSAVDIIPTGTPTPSLAALSSNQVAFIDSVGDALRTYAFNGSTWVQEGSSLAIATVSTPAITALSSSRVAFIDATNDTLNTYQFDGNGWSQVGSGLAISGVGNNPALASLSSNRLAFFDQTSDSLSTYQFSAPLLYVSNSQDYPFFSVSDGGQTWAEALSVRTELTLGQSATSTTASSSPVLSVNGRATFSSNVGIGTTTPWAKLAIVAGVNQSNPLFEIASSSQGTSLFAVTGAGNVGVGTTSPQSKLHVAGGNIAFDIGANNGIFQTALTSHANGNVGSLGFGISDGGGQSGVFVNNRDDGTYNSQDITFLTAEGGVSVATERLRITKAGNVGIGTTTPQSKLSVVSGTNGTLNFPTGNWAAQIYNQDDSSTSGGLVVGNRWLANTSTVLDVGSLYGSGSAWSSFFTVKGGGNVGIGTTTPNGSLAIVGTANSYGTLSVYGNAGGLTTTNIFAAYQDNADAPTAAKFVIQRGGNVGIGTTTPAALLNSGTFGKALDITGTNPILTLHNSSDPLREANFYNFTGGLYIDSTGAATASNNGIYFRTNNTNSSNTSGILTAMSISSAAYVGVGTTSPFRKLAVTEAVSTAQLAISYDTTRYSQFLTDASGDLVIDPSGADAFLNDDNLWVCTGGSCPAGTPTGTGNLIVENQVGIATSTPTGILSVKGVGTGTGYTFVTSDSSSVQRFNIQDNGNVGIGTTTPSAQLATAGLIFVGGNGATTLGTATSTFYGDIKIAGKLDVGTIDPVYTVDGIKFATYGHSTIGIHEETLKTIQLTEKDENGKYAYVIDFDAQEKGSDLWLFYQITDFGESWQSLVVSLTPSFDGKVFYKKVPEKRQLIVYSDEAGEVSMRLAGNRFDFSKWPNLRTDQDGDTVGTHIITSKPALTPMGVESTAHISR